MLFHLLHSIWDISKSSELLNYFNEIPCLLNDLILSPRVYKKVAHFKNSFLKCNSHCILFTNLNCTIQLFYIQFCNIFITPTLPTKACLVKAMVFPVVMYGYESWTIKKAECQRIDAFKVWCWRRLLRVPWTARRSNQSILK